MTKHENEPIVLEEEHIQRIRRIGKKLLNVANCLVTFGSVGDKQFEGEKSVATVEAQFINSLPLVKMPEFVDDTRQDRFLSNHKNVVGAPYIRFYASYPVKSKVRNDEVVGNVRVLDYSPRVLSDEERDCLRDLAALVERELELLSADAARQDLLKKNWSLRRESMIDSVSGTWNRAAIMRMLKQEVEQCRANEKPLSMVMTDLDGFKKINEHFGSNIGDALLVKTASRLRSCIRPHDSLGRFEDGKFLILLPGATHDIAKMVAMRLQHAIKSNAEMVGGKSIELTITSGTVSTDQFASANSDELLSLACTTLQSAQKLGSNSIVQAAPRNN
ncbi:MAG: sensor domain-containing diguanylate cyclase [Oxalobacter sp.]|nr:MAG: sensor domain-containing diguanylate cyclase [Oxalobacter sp.]